MSHFDDREQPLGELMCEVIGLADEAVTDRLAGDELARRRELLKFEAYIGPDTPPAQSRIRHGLATAAAGMRRCVAALRPTTAVAMVVLFGFLGTGLTVTALHRQQERQQFAHFMDLQTQSATRAVSASLSRYTELVDSLAAAVGGLSDSDTVRFWDLSAPMDQQPLPAAAGVAYVVAGHTTEIPQLQASWRALGVSQLDLRPAGSSDSHLFPVLSWPPQSATDVVGSDLSVRPEVADALQDARRTRTTVTSRTYVTPTRQSSAVLSAPVYDTTDDFRGWMVLSLRWQILLAESLDGITTGGMSVRLADIDHEELATYGQTEDAEATRSTLVLTSSRELALRISADERPGGSGGVLAMWLVGSVATALLTALTSTATRRRNGSPRRDEPIPLAAGLPVLDDPAADEDDLVIHGERVSGAGWRR
ncbi:CHASE domain-containing protein [Actinoplanes sp. CA-252034]|uniref:CHASE domain-containing protein n=1 Tax=Actinoplanes sp. CA-252034 TaxID=3239906 RepID=UPI003D958420